jgi:hypothetical protein
VAGLVDWFQFNICGIIAVLDELYAAQAKSLLHGVVNTNGQLLKIIFSSISVNVQEPMLMIDLSSSLKSNIMRSSGKKIVERQHFKQ